MKMRMLVIAAVLAVCVQGLGFAQSGRADIEYSTLVEKVLAYYDTGDYAAAIPLLKRMNVLKSGELAPVEDLGVIYLNIPEDRPKFTNALFWLAEAEKRGSSNPSVYYSLACIYSLKGELDKAGTAIEKSIALGYSGFEWMNQDDNLVNFRTGSWWKSIAKNYTQIEKQFALFDEFSSNEEGKRITDRITFYSGMVTALKQLAPHIPALQCAPLSFLAYSYLTMGNYVSAEQSLLETKTIREKVFGKDHPYYAQTVNNLGLLYTDMGDYAKAESCYLESRAIFEKALGKEHPDYATSLDNLGGLYSNMGNYTKALEYCLEAKFIREKTLGKEHFQYAESLNNLGILYSIMGDYAKAETCYLEVKAIFEKTGYSKYATFLYNMGALYYSMGNYAKAERYYLDAKTLDENILGKEHPSNATTLNSLGVLYLNMGDYAKAGRCLLEAVNIRKKALGKEHPFYADSLGNLYLLYLSKKDYKQALTSKQEQNNINTSVVKQNFSFLSEQQRDAYWNSNSYSFESSYSLSFFNPIPASNILNYDNALFSKGLLLRTTNAVRDAIYASGNQSLINQFEKLGKTRQQISVLRQKGGNDAYIKNLEAEADALDKSLVKSSAAFRELQADLAVNWTNVKKSLRPGEAAVEFVSFKVYDKKWTDKTQYAALLLKPDSKAPVWVPLCDEEELQKLLSLAAGGRNSREQARILYNANGLALFDTIWKPLEKELAGVTTIYYSPSGLLHKIALNALPIDDSYTKRLTDKYNLNLVSSTREVVHLNRSQAAAQITSAVLYGGLDFDTKENDMRKAAQAYQKNTKAPTGASVPPQGAARGSGQNSLQPMKALKNSLPEVQNIQGYLNRNKISNSLYKDSLGNEESFKQLSGKKTDLIHLATHGFFLADVKHKHDDREQQQRGNVLKAEENPLLRSGLLLAGANNILANKPVKDVEDGILTADEIAGMNLLGTKLVVMSACQTGLGDVNNGEGVFGLQRAFKLAGVETLVMSLWEVDDAATAKLMSVFYQEWLFSGKSRQEAFKEAQKQVRAEYPLPYYWAAFVMMD